jgi:serine/threonine protein kinase
VTRQTISWYRINDKVAGGEMGIVNRAEQVTLGYSVALKFLPDGAARDPRTLRYVEREAQCACALNHPNVYTIHEIDDQLCMGGLI